ncbi:MAG: ADP-forming succinate--CoA ligase subunit beta [Candidatus Marinimicrobia bacterium]|mgnify:FL=1|nr:ADP-forming succinate--CoA ligase subunit beta [Candidatus Neomarinimicrobiota bacterium]MBT4828010.1 ADP-forming succinate--CoA ligase subunit beta [Candidatus Neomarinimicrobiota bacterium]MBT6980764.1 ADP-forming succinate--CoA ligase subunit beta [Candidatus Neomarinimicrobiota bacterium]MBT7118920.1 ADP-forming succinate--CoA ligase subunit beta [Candidatus Neomarinimicrobiota bacterium]MBT7372793.1 ADP-forming succinate--CoA ligase subunit beta [Candidatus Neomarinimicrobiota bacterium
MKIHEYQAKKIFANFGMPVQDGYVFENIEETEPTIRRVQKDFNTEDVVVKAQIHAGGRGKGGGVKYSPNFDIAIQNAKNILGMNLVTHQTGEKGQLVRKVYVTEAFDIAEEYYAAITLDRGKSMDVFMISSEGGVEIEKVAAETPEKIVKVWIDPLLGMKSFQARKLAYGLNLSGDAFKAAMKIFMQMYHAYQSIDATIVEVNPLILTTDGRIVVLDAKVNLDDNALFRHKDISDMRDFDEEDPMEVEARKFSLNYIKLDGNVGCMVNGAGLAMATMDIIKLAGGEPANFLDVGGSASAETVKNGFRIILSDENVKAVLINIFGGIVRCDRVANGVVQAVKELGLKVPVVVRLEGTNSREAQDILAKSGVDIIPAIGMKDAAEKVVNAALGN